MCVLYSVSKDIVCSSTDYEPTLYKHSQRYAALFINEGCLLIEDCLKTKADIKTVLKTMLSPYWDLLFNIEVDTEVTEENE